MQAEAQGRGTETKAKLPHEVQALWVVLTKMGRAQGLEAGLRPFSSALGAKDGEPGTEGPRLLFWSRFP